MKADDKKDYMGKRKNYPSERLKTDIVVCVYDSLITDLKKREKDDFQFRQAVVGRLNAKPAGKMHRIRVNLRKARDVLPGKV